MPALRKPTRTPLADLALLQREVNQLFARLANLERSEPPPEGEWVPSVDVYECRGNVVVVAEVPGLQPESLKVAVRDHTLVISGERRERRPAGLAAFLCMERPHGRFVRKLPLEVAVDVRKSEARLQGGLLTILLPSLKDRRGRETQIPVRRGEQA